MQAKETSRDGLMIQYQCTIDAKDIDSKIEAEIARLTKTVKISGFRPGKVPAKVVKQRYGKNVEGDVLTNAITDGITKTIKENALRPALAPSLESQDYAAGKDFTFAFKVEVLPEVAELDYSAIKLKRTTFEIGEKDIEEALTKLAERSPIPSELPNTTKAKTGHVVDIDFVGKIDGEAFQGGSGEHHPLELGSNAFIPGFEEQLEGIKATEERVVTVNFPENYFNQGLAGKEATFDVTCHNVSELKTPEVDEKFATDRGFEDLQAFKDAVKEQMSKEIDAVVRNDLKKQLFDDLEMRVDFDVPEGMHKMEFEAIWQKVQAAKEEGDKSIEGKDENELKAEYEAIANRRVRLGILLADIGHRETIDVNQDEMSNALMQYASNFPGQEVQVVEFFKNNPQKMDEFRGPILEEKAVDWIFGKISYDDKEMSVKDILDGALEADEE